MLADARDRHAATMRGWLDTQRELRYDWSQSEPSCAPAPAAFVVPGADAAGIGGAMPGRRREHYAGDYDRRAADVRARANADPSTVCKSPTCKGWGTRTLAEHKPGSTWDAGHVRDGDPTSPLQPEVSGCNRSDGATRGNRRRVGITPTRDW